MTDLPTMEALSREAAAVRERVPAEEALRGRHIALYGTGFLGRWAVDHLRGAGVEPTICFDGNPAKQGGTFHDIPVAAFPDTSGALPDAVLITARHAVQSIAPMLDRHGLSACSFDGWYVGHRFPQFAALHDALFTDEQSCQTLRAVLHAMLTGDLHPLSAVFERDQYFCLPHLLSPGEDYYVDAGAFVGDSVERFIWATGGAFKKIWAFEPFDRPFQALTARTERLSSEWALNKGQITPVRAGLGAVNGQSTAVTDGGHMQSAALTPIAEGAVPILALDDYLDGQPVTFFKADVEGMEMELLAGASRTISRYRPKLAICVYHYPCDLPDIVARIRSYVPDYKFALRHHSSQQMETVLYGWIE